MALACIFVLNQLFFQNEGRKLNHMEVASEKRRAQDPIGQHVGFLMICGKTIFTSCAGEARRQREMAEDRAEKRKREREESGEPSVEKTRVLSVTLEQVTPPVSF